MSSKLGPGPKQIKDLRDAQNRVRDFDKKFGDFVSHASVTEQRAIIRLCRMVIEKHSGNLSWNKMPSYWKPDVPFADPNNNKKNKPDLKEIVLFLVDKVKKLMQTTETQNRAPESSSAASERQDSGMECRIWSEKVQRKRIKDHLFLCSSLGLDDQLNNRLRAIVDKWTVSELLIKGNALELLIGKLKLASSDPQRADEIRKQLQKFADEETVVSTTLPASVRELNFEDVSDSEMCSIKTHVEKKTQEEEEKTQEEEKSAEREMPLPDRGNDNSWRSTMESDPMESDPDDSEQMVDLDLQEDMEKEIISSDSVECVTDKDEDRDFSCRLLEGNMMEGTSEEQTLGPGSQEEDDDCDVVQKLLDEVFESILGREGWRDLRKVIMEEPKTLGVPGVPPSAGFKVMEEPKMLSVPDILPPNAEQKKRMPVHGIHVHLDNFDTLNLDQQLDYLKTKAFINRLRRAITPKNFHQCLVPALCERIASKPNYSDSSRNIFHDLYLQAASDKTLCFSCQKMHREVSFRFVGHNIT